MNLNDGLTRPDQQVDSEYVPEQEVDPNFDVRDSICYALQQELPHVLVPDRDVSDKVLHASVRAHIRSMGIVSLWYMRTRS
jgi:hypothetical protein